MKTPICDMIESAIRLCEENDCTVEFVKMSPMLWHYFNTELLKVSTGKSVHKGSFVFTNNEVKYAGIRVLHEPRFEGSTFAVKTKQRELEYQDKTTQSGAPTC